MRRECIVLSASVLICALFATSNADAQSANHARRPVRRYSGIDAGQEAYLIHENQRRGAITAQMALNDDMQMLRGLPPKYFEFFPANPFDAVLTPGPAVDAVWDTPYYVAPPDELGVPGIPDAVEFETELPDAIDGEPDAAKPAEAPQAPVPNPPRPAGTPARPTVNRPLLNRAGQPLRPEELPAPAEVREQLKKSGPRQF